MYYIPPFKVVKDRINLVKVNGKTKVNTTYDEFVELIKLLLRGAAFDESWYLSTYPDVAQAVTAGVFNSGRQHFIEVGYFEGRRPLALNVDEHWYLTTYPDVVEAIKKSSIKSAEQHFQQHGYEEGRLPGSL